jgi:hypothetical protein
LRFDRAEIEHLLAGKKQEAFMLANTLKFGANFFRAPGCSQRFAGMLLD